MYVDSHTYYFCIIYGHLSRFFCEKNRNTGVSIKKSLGITIHGTLQSTNEAHTVSGFRLFKHELFISLHT